MALRSYNIQGQKARFNKSAFQQILKTKSNNEKRSITKLTQTLADQLQISTDTVHNWYYKENGPSDYAMLERLANALGVSDTSQLLEIIDEGDHTMIQYSDRQLSAIKRIYDICVWFLHEFEKSDGFNNYWHHFAQKGSANPKLDIEELADGMLAKVKLVLDQEYFDLHNFEIYTKLHDFVIEDLMDTYDGKLSYAYRFEAIPNGNPTTEDDYNKAIIRLNSIIDKCVSD